MLKLFPKYLNFGNISKKCIRVPGPLDSRLIVEVYKNWEYQSENKKKRNLLRKSPYSVRKRENTDQKKLRIWTLLT